MTLRRNHHEILDWGWSHDQDNDKLIREVNKKVIVLAQEKGYNTYKKVRHEAVRKLHLPISHVSKDSPRQNLFQKS